MCQPSQISWHQLLYLFCDKYKISTPVTLGSVEMSKAAGRVEEASFAFHGTVRLQPSDDSCLLVGVKRKTFNFCFLRKKTSACQHSCHLLLAPQQGEEDTAAYEVESNG